MGQDLGLLCARCSKRGSTTVALGVIAEDLFEIRIRDHVRRLIPFVADLDLQLPTLL